MISAKLFFDKRHPKKDGTYTIRVGVTNVGNFYIATGVSCLPEDWSGHNVSKSDKSHKAKNAKLAMIMDKVNMAILSVERENSRVSNQELKDLINGALSGEPSSGMNLVDALKSHLANKSARQTILSYLQTEDKIFKYDKDADIRDVNYTWLVGFNKFMINDGLSVNSAAIHMRNLRAVVNHAIDNEWSDSYPFRRFKIKTRETPKRSLSIPEFQSLMSYPVEDHLVRYRDVFILTFYLCGINLVDLSDCREITKDGRIEYYRSKTGKFYSIKVGPEALAIINKYRGKEYLLDIRENYADYLDYNRKVNKMLKRIGPVEIGVYGKKTFKPLFPDISLYWARHSWATIAAELGVPDETISQALGHSTTNATTAIYINRNRDKVDAANRKIMDKVLGIEQGTTAV